MFEIKLVGHQPLVEKEIELTNSAGYKYKLKVISPKCW